MKKLRIFLKNHLPRFILNFLVLLKTRKFIIFKGIVRYYEDELLTSHKCDFIYDQKFKSIYESAVKDQLAISPNIRWRAHVMCWAATNCMQIDGDFVECGVNRGFLSKIIIDFVKFSDSNKKFYLLDTYQGFAEKYLSPSELAKGMKSGGYEPCYEFVSKYFAKYTNVIIVKGAVPDTLKLVDADKIAFLSLDMNNAIPEIEAFLYFWDKIVDGGIIVLDDYGHAGHEEQKIRFDNLAISLSFNILSLPTGQGLIIKQSRKNTYA